MIVRFGRLTRRLLIVAVALGSMLVLAGCGISTQPLELTLPGPGNRHAISISDDGISPANMAANMGQLTFEITNDGTKPHNLAYDDNGFHFASPTIEPGQTITWQTIVDTPSPIWFYSSLNDDRANGVEANVYVATGHMPEPIE